MAKKMQGNTTEAISLPEKITKTIGLQDKVKNMNRGGSMTALIEITNRERINMIDRAETTNKEIKDIRAKEETKEIRDRAMIDQIKDTRMISSMTDRKEITGKGKNSSPTQMKEDLKEISTLLKTNSTKRAITISSQEKTPIQKGNSMTMNADPPMTIAEILRNRKDTIPRKTTTEAKRKTHSSKSGNQKLRMTLQSKSPKRKLSGSNKPMTLTTLPEVLPTAKLPKVLLPIQKSYNSKAMKNRLQPEAEQAVRYAVVVAAVLLKTNDATYDL
jgi:hypothetical protein